MRTDYKDFIASTENRHYRQVNNDDGTISLVDETVYTQEGDKVSAGVLNELSQNAIWPLQHAKSGTTHQLTGLTGVSGIVSCVFTATADFAEGDTVTVDGEAYAVQLSNGETAQDNLFVTGAAVAVLVDKGNKKANFKAGGGYVKGDVIAAENLEYLCSLNPGNEQNFYSMDIPPTGTLFNSNMYTCNSPGGYSDGHVKLYGYIKNGFFYTCNFRGHGSTTNLRVYKYFIEGIRITKIEEAQISVTAKDQATMLLEDPVEVDVFYLATYTGVKKINPFTQEVIFEKTYESMGGPASLTSTVVHGVISANFEYFYLYTQQDQRIFKIKKDGSEYYNYLVPTTTYIEDMQCMCMDDTGNLYITGPSSSDYKGGLIKISSDTFTAVVKKYFTAANRFENYCCVSDGQYVYFHSVSYIDTTATKKLDNQLTEIFDIGTSYSYEHSIHCVLCPKTSLNQVFIIRSNRPVGFGSSRVIQVSKKDESASGLTTQNMQAFCHLLFYDPNSNLAVGIYSYSGDSAYCISDIPVSYKVSEVAK